MHSTYSQRVRKSRINHAVKKEVIITYNTVQTVMPILGHEQYICTGSYSTRLLLSNYKHKLVTQ